MKRTSRGFFGGVRMGVIATLALAGGAVAQEQGGAQPEAKKGGFWKQFKDGLAKTGSDAADQVKNGPRKIAASFTVRNERTGHIDTYTCLATPAGEFDPDAKPVIRNEHPGSVTFGLSPLSLASCGDYLKNGTPMQFYVSRPATTAPSSGDAASSGHDTIASTELAGFFERHPQPGGGKVVQWPRVAITLVEAPADHLKAASWAGHPNPLPRGCWKFIAKIWDAPNKSRDVKPFYKCSEEGVRVQTGNEGTKYQIWSGLFSSTEYQEGWAGSTGIQRTSGPTPPDTPLPTTVAYKRGNFLNTFSGIVIAEMVDALRMDYRSEDHRLWVNLDPSLEPR